MHYIKEEEPLGTGGAIKNAEGLLKNEEGFFVLNGDILTNIDIKRIVVERGFIGSIALVPLKSPYGIVEIEKDEIKNFVEKPQLKDYWINAGIYYFSSKIFNYLPEKGDIEKSVFPELIKKEKLKGTKFENVIWKSIDTHKDIEEAEKEVIPWLSSSI